MLALKENIKNKHLLGDIYFMTTLVDTSRHVIPGQGHHGLHAHGSSHVPVGSGTSHGHSTTYHVVHHSPGYLYDYDPYYVSPYSGQYGILAGGITLLIVGVALAIFGLISLAFGDLPWGITNTVAGLLLGGAGAALIGWDVWSNKD
jgi:hypothetical protein